MLHSTREWPVTSHVRNICLYYRRKHVASVRLCLTQKPTTRLMHSRYIDYTNGLLRGIPDCLISRLQSVGNGAAWLVVCYRWDHITWVLTEVEWLSMKENIHHAILLWRLPPTSPIYSTNKDIVLCVFSALRSVWLNASISICSYSPSF